MKRMFAVLPLIFLTLISYGQRGYFIKDSVRSVGVIVLDGGAVKNAMRCQIKDKNQVMTFSPDEVKEYGFQNGNVYVSKTIRIDEKEKKVFLERFSEGKLNFYFFRDRHGRRFFIEKDSGNLVEVLRKNADNQNFRYFLRQYTEDCKNTSDALKVAAFNKLSLTKFAELYNGCSTKPLPFIRLGLIAGLQITQLQKSQVNGDLLTTPEYPKEYSFNLGVFADIPIMLTYWSFHPELYFQTINCSSTFSIKNTEYTTTINATSLNFPFLIRYTLPTNTIRPYANIGGLFLYNIQNDNETDSKTRNPDGSVTQKVSTTIVYSTQQIGYAIGCGVQFSLDYRKAIFIELRYNQLKSITQETYSGKSIQGIIGVNL